MIELNVSGMTCDRCADHVREALEKLPGVQSVEVSYPQAVSYTHLTLPTICSV